MNEKQALLSQLHQARLDRLKEVCAEFELSRTGSVEVVRARLIADLILDEWDLSDDGIANILNKDLGSVMAIFGIKKSGSIRQRRQRLWLHLNRDAKQLIPEKMEHLTREELHDLCIKLDLPRSGTKQALLMRVAGVLTSQTGSWGSIKKSLRRPRGEVKPMVIPSPSEIEEAEHIPEEIPVESNIEIIEFEEIIEIDEPMVDTFDEIELTTGVLDIENRVAEVDSMCREFLVFGDITDPNDVEAFIDGLSQSGLMVDDSNVRTFISNRLNYLQRQSQEEIDAIHSTPNSWVEREALRRFEESRSRLRESLKDIIQDNPNETVQARMAFEQQARDLGLDLRIPAISGRVHALFDLQISLDEDVATTDPRGARRIRVIRLLQHGAIHLKPEERRCMDRLERNIAGFEQLVETIMEKSEGTFNEAQQALVIRFLDKRGYEVNTPELRPRVISAAGVLGAELGYITPAEIPKMAPGIMVSDTEVDSIITELKRLSQQFGTPQAEKTQDVDEELAESVADASDRVDAARKRLDGVDDLLARLKVTK
ncbi:MAG TPA: hypothetical protein EYQ73_03945 [Candidatus Poseidoniales archaeon]|nr:hypothetical protein [Candidatus Poseidoniales archaeon]HIL65582.1 hypothetical protein [Candidatus Poseidoniales archaeon]